jgi:hypothetical protein
MHSHGMSSSEAANVELPGPSTSNDIMYTIPPNYEILPDESDESSSDERPDVPDHVGDVDEPLNLDGICEDDVYDDYFEFVSRQFYQSQISKNSAGDIYRIAI